MVAELVRQRCTRPESWRTSFQQRGSRLTSWRRLSTFAFAVLVICIVGSVSAWDMETETFLEDLCNENAWLVSNCTDWSQIAPTNVSIGAPCWYFLCGPGPSGSTEITAIPNARNTSLVLTFPISISNLTGLGCLHLYGYQPYNLTINISQATPPAYNVYSVSIIGASLNSIAINLSPESVMPTKLG